MTVAARFAATYGFLPSQCHEKERMGLLANMDLAAAARSLQFYDALAAVLSPDALADLLRRSKAPAREVNRALMAGLRQSVTGGRP